MIKLSLTQLANELQLEKPTREVEFEGISSDTRTIKARNLFVAIQGENFDGNEFITEASNKGAAAALVNRHHDSPLPQLIVKDTINALGKITEYWRDQFNLSIIAVTGSNGKTTLKNMIASILRAACDHHEQVLATEGNLNNNIGLPLMLARLNDNHRFAVLEMGMNHFHEIAYLTKLAKPQVAVITNAAESHLEGVGDVSGVARAKGEIFEGLQPNGTAILNKDDAHFDYWKKLIGSRSFLCFGLSNPADVSATITPSHILLNTPKGTIDVKLPLLGKHNVMNALAATASALAINIDLNTIKTGLENVHAAPGRMRQYWLENGALLIDDTYNANPFSTQAALNTLKSLQGKKILVLADMKELGENSHELHVLTGHRAKEANIDYLFTFGKLTEATAKAYGTGAQHFIEKEKLLTALKPFLQKNVTVLIKGSRSMKMEEIVEKLVPIEQLEHH